MKKSSETVKVLSFSFWLNPNVVTCLRAQSAVAFENPKSVGYGIQNLSSYVLLDSVSPAVVSGESAKYEYFSICGWYGF